MVDKLSKGNNSSTFKTVSIDIGVIGVQGKATKNYNIDQKTNKQKSLLKKPGAVARSEASSLGMQAVPSSIPTSGIFFRGDLVMKTFLRPFSLFR